MNRFAIVLLLLSGFIAVANSKCQLSGSKNYCNSYYCYLYSNATGQVGETLTHCFPQSSYYYRYVFIYFHGSINIELDLPGNFRYLYFYVRNALSYVTMSSKRVHPNITNLSFRYQSVHFSQPSFFDFFPNLKYLYAASFLYFVQPQTFSALTKLSSFTVKPPTGSITWQFDFVPNAFHGLTNLKYIELVRADITDVRYTFQGLSTLNHLGLEGNKIEELEPDMFKDLQKLNYLDLDGNGIKVASADAFNGMTSLKYLTLSGNPSFPLDSITRIKTLTGLQINYNSYRTLSPHIFEQLPAIKRIYADNPFFCDCSLRWTSLVSRYGIRIYSATCLEPSKLYQTPITTQDIYSNCTDNSTYDCFSKTNTCSVDFICRDTQSGHACTCTDGFSLTHNGVCVDENECQMGLAHCAQSCVNTVGSYECACDAGFQLSADDTTCEDINECEMGLVECLGTDICVNSKGSYVCVTVGCSSAQLANRNSTALLAVIVVLVLVIIILVIVVVVVIVVAGSYIKKNKFKTFFQAVPTHYSVPSGERDDDDTNLLEAVNTSDVGGRSVDLFPAPTVN